ncbi:solute carrier family 35 member B1 homolog [Tribolium castaneum]|uniref:Solute carrier family 35 member B1 homolog-like Protein n=1 Tax=Tribolium castaneum TaxID=7070 RepID=D6WJY4_TRICA|nr:PREDICTED: solute carrier family 35 member B1 homolog [Tribolium castaneum]EFA03644.1 Solute carrier family 35 member B1 homolog-like Protein [Tribolium castaneum]|eukprot:XP_974276.1 PREDICTED: solute carrier family 35 member B1 homolog [Tribolium castaneum]
MNKTNKFLLEAAAIFVTYFYFGILQEKITKGKYTYEATDDKGEKIYLTEKYTYFLTLVFILCATSYAAACIFLKIWRPDEDKTPRLYYISIAITYLLAMVCSNMALQWVPYPTQVVGKSAKPIPVMILGVLLGKKSYPFKKYIFVLLIVVGVVLFMFKDKGKPAQQDMEFGLGELLLILSLMMDGMTGGVQERIRAEAQPTGQQMMKASNGWSVLFLGCALVTTGEGFQFLEFAKRHPNVTVNLLVLGLTQAVGQMFLYNMVSDFGPLVVSVVTTTRKFFTFLGSVIIFGNALSVRQWIGTLIVFTGLFLDTFFSKKATKKSPSN